MSAQKSPDPTRSLHAKAATARSSSGLGPANSRAAAKRNGAGARRAPMERAVPGPTETIRARVAAAAGFIRERWRPAPRVGIILGTGMGNLANHLRREMVLSYREVPHFPRSTALGHKGQLVCGALAGVAAILMDGRSHLYEGYSVEQITLPVRVIRALGASLLVISNASGGINPKLARGDIVLIDSHIDLTWRRFDHFALAGPFGRPVRLWRSPYDPALIERSLEIARRENFVAHRGVYVAVTGPNYETRAEYRFFRRIGGDVVGMSTAAEAVAAAALGMRVLAISTVTNVAKPDAPCKVEAGDVITAAAGAEPNVRKIVTAIVASYGPGQSGSSKDENAGKRGWSSR